MTIADQFALYLQGPKVLNDMLAGLSESQLAWQPPESAGVGRWTIQQVVVHLADCEGVYADRMKRVIAEDGPILLAFDENLWAERLGYSQQSTADAAELITLTRRQLGRVLASLPESDFASRFGTHSQSGRKTLGDLLAGATNHFLHHLKFIQNKRDKLLG